MKPIKFVFLILFISFLSSFCYAMTSERCTGPAGLDCIDKALVNPDSGTIAFALANNLGDTMELMNPTDKEMYLEEDCSLEDWFEISSIGGEFSKITKGETYSIENSERFVIRLTCKEGFPMARPGAAFKVYYNIHNESKEAVIDTRSSGYMQANTLANFWFKNSGTVWNVIATIILVFLIVLFLKYKGVSVGNLTFSLVLFSFASTIFLSIFNILYGPAWIKIYRYFMWNKYVFIIKYLHVDGLWYIILTWILDIIFAYLIALAVVKGIPKIRELITKKSPMRKPKP